MVFTLSNWSISLLPGNSASLFNSSAKMQPTDHMSIAVVYSFAPSNSSGALYHNVTTSCVMLPMGLPYFLANPKSATLISPRLFSSKLLVFKSRWMIQLSCISATADSSCSINVLISDCRNGDRISCIRPFKSCSMKSMTMKTLYKIAWITRFLSCDTKLTDPCGFP